MKNRLIATAAGVALAATLALPAHAQARQGGNTVISANPFGLLLNLFNAEVETKVSQAATAGVGGSMYQSGGGVDYLNLDAFWRFYPDGQPLEGFSFGVKLGITSGDDNLGAQKTFLGYGFDLNRSWLKGPNKNFAISIGFGLKRLVTDETDASIIPTIRLVNVGFRF